MTTDRGPKERSRGEECSSPDPRIWSRLPDILVERVIARLPLPQLGQLRVLSKGWRSNIVSGSFHKLRVDASMGSHPGFLLFPPYLYTTAKFSLAAALDPSTSKWSRFCFPSVPLSEQAVRAEWLNFSTPIADSVDDCPCGQRVRDLWGFHFLKTLRDPHVWLATDEGLACVLYMKHATRLLIINPLLGCFQQLPKPGIVESMKKPFLLTLSVDTKKNKFYVILVGSVYPIFSNVVVTEVYDSSSDTWTVAGELPEKNWRLANFLEGGNSLHARLGNLLFYLVNAGGYLELLCFNLQERVWNAFPELTFPSALGQRLTFFERKGKLILVKNECRGQDATWMPIIYSWWPGSLGQWTEIASAPPPSITLFSPLHIMREEHDVQYVGKDDWIFFFSKNIDAGNMSGYLYNLSDMSWRGNLPKPFLTHTCFGLRVIPFEFSLRDLKSFGYRPIPRAPERSCQKKSKLILIG